MASKDDLLEVGGRLSSPPSDVNELLPVPDDDGSKPSELIISDELQKGSEKVDQVDSAEAAMHEKLPEQAMNDDGNMINDNSGIAVTSSHSLNKELDDHSLVDSAPVNEEIMNSGKEAHDTDVEEKMKSSSKRARGAQESPKTRLDGSLVGSRIKVWWPDDRQYYEGIVQTYNPSTKKHKILYDDGDIEILLLKSERWLLLDKDNKKEKVKDDSIPEASSEVPQSKKAKASTSSVSKEGARGTESGHSSKRKGQPTKGVAGTKTIVAEVVPGGSSKAVEKSSAKKNVGTKSATKKDACTKLLKSGTKKDAATKSKTGIRLNDDAANTPKISSKTKDDAGSIKGKLNKDKPSADLASLEEEESKISEA